VIAVSDSLSLQIRKESDLDSPPWCYLLWGVPAALAIATSIVYGRGILPATFAGILWTASVAWAGVGCFINGRRCGRVHCKIDGVLFPVLSIAGALNVLALVSFSWTIFWGVFLLILLASFLPEWSWKKYS